MMKVDKQRTVKSVRRREGAAVEVERRNFLRGRFKPEPDVIRPPFAIVESDFLSKCEQCPDCVTSCEETIIVMGEDGTPRISFDLGECTFCGDCLAACKTGALDRDEARPWKIKAAVGSNCLSLNSVFCRTCGDNCEADAIAFKLMIGGRSTPVIDIELCTGCGACSFVCPNKSIQMLRGQETKRPAITEGREIYNT